MASFQRLSDWEEIDHVSMHIVNKLRMAVHLLDEHHLQSANQAQIPSRKHIRVDSRIHVVR
jgi:hypothetical protein